ncbi:MAG TPA: porin, partial [Planctomycetota bacterium]|nr:porin [Planctomycetota bacterium]
MKTCWTKAAARGAAALVLLAAAAAAQETEARFADLERRIGALQAEVRERAAREAELAGKVTTLEAKLAERDASEAQRLAELESRLAGRPDPVEDAIRRLEALEASPAAGSRLRVGGYFDLEIRDDEATDRFTFDQHRFVLKFDGDVTDRISFRSEVEFEGGGAGASYLTDNYVAVEFAELHFKFDRAFSLKAGALLTPFGRYNYLHDSPLQDLTDRPLVATYVAPTTWTETGVGAYGAFDLGGVRLDYDVLLSNGFDQGFS